MPTDPELREIDTTAWARRAAFEHFVDFDVPFFSVATRIDVTALKPALAAAGSGTVTLALHFVTLRLVQALPPLRWRLRGRRVVEHRRVHASTTVLRADGSFGFAQLAAEPDFARFCAAGAQALAAARDGATPFDPRPGDDAVVHCTTLPWVHFTAFAHARRGGGGDSVPKLAFGRIDAETGADGRERRWLPLQLDVHHALLDGIVAGRFVLGFEAAMRDPLPWVRPGGGDAIAPGLPGAAAQGAR